MAAAAPPPIPSSFKNPNPIPTSLKPFPLFVPGSIKKRRHFRCQINQPSDSVVDIFLKNGPHHLTHNSSSSLAASASASASISKTPKRICLFYCDDTEPLARRIAGSSDSIELRNIKWRYVYTVLTSFEVSSLI